ncbi:DUF4148 domain-containing protein [Paraburkholderia bengalensis]|uniref:DUF4148 domain-containing protein n=1 Tax=Paraburkholderia bengalensis TaxID=2747562 RepID=A0ABU8J4A8_9BURK
MRSTVIATAAALALSLPVAAFSQTDSTVTRAQVRAELQQLEQAGYDPSRGEDPTYPVDIQAAEARVWSEKGTTGYGGVTSGTSGSGARAVSRPASTEDMKQLYFGGE